MLNTLRCFGRDEMGAVTVDFVVLTAAVGGVGIATMTVIGGGTQTVTGEVHSSLCDIVLNGDFDISRIPEAQQCIE